MTFKLKVLLNPEFHLTFIVKHSQEGVTDESIIPAVPSWSSDVPETDASIILLLNYAKYHNIVKTWRKKKKNVYASKLKSVCATV